MHVFLFYYISHIPRFKCILRSKEYLCLVIASLRSYRISLKKQWSDSVRLGGINARHRLSGRFHQTWFFQGINKQKATNKKEIIIGPLVIYFSSCDSIGKREHYLQIFRELLLR